MPTIPEDYCDCNYEPVRGIKAGRHLPSCRYGIIEDWELGMRQELSEPEPSHYDHGPHFDTCPSPTCVRARNRRDLPS